MVPSYRKIVEQHIRNVKQSMIKHNMLNRPHPLLSLKLIRKKEKNTNRIKIGSKFGHRDHNPCLILCVIL